MKNFLSTTNINIKKKKARTEEQGPYPKLVRIVVIKIPTLQQKKKHIFLVLWHNRISNCETFGRISVFQKNGERILEEIRKFCEVWRT